MRLSPRRVVARYLEARVVPFRRDREYAAYRAFLKRVRKLQETLDSLQPLLNSNAELEELLPYNLRLDWDSDRFLRTFKRDLGDRRDIQLNQDMPQDYFQDRSNTRTYLDFALQDAERNLQRTDIGRIGAVVESSDFRDKVQSYLDYGYITPAEVKALLESVEAGIKIRDEIAMLRKRMKRTRDPSEVSGIPASAEMGDVETLYHASVDAKGLYRDGFSDTMPAESSSAGLGGSQSLGGGKGSGISFTEDLYVAKEIARVFKEVAMIARGELGLSAMLDWVKRSPYTKKIMEWYHRNYRACDRCSMDPRNPMRFVQMVFNEDHLADVKAGRAKYDPKLSQVMQEVPYSEVFPGPEGVMGLYLSYLNFSGRYDPKFFGVGGPKGLVKRFKGLNPKDIGYIEATVNTAHPSASYGVGEREVRVPPEAVLSVDKFVG